MFKYLNKKRQKGQSTLEYAILIIIVIGALLSIQVYIKRALDGSWKDSADSIGQQFSVGNTNVTKTMTVSGKTSETFVAGETKSTLLQAETTTDLLDSTIHNVNQEYWGG